MNRNCRLVCSKCDPCFSSRRRLQSFLWPTVFEEHNCLAKPKKKLNDSCMTQKKDILNALTFGLINCKTANRRFGTVGSKRFLVFIKVC
jgi:hypothetical protein